MNVLPKVIMSRGRMCSREFSICMLEIMILSNCITIGYKNGI